MLRLLLLLLLLPHLPHLLRYLRHIHSIEIQRHNKRLRPHPARRHLKVLLPLPGAAMREQVRPSKAEYFPATRQRDPERGNAVYDRLIEEFFGPSETDGVGTAALGGAVPEKPMVEPPGPGVGRRCRSVSSCEFSEFLVELLPFLWA